jgi:hypothetical protein
MQTLEKLISNSPNTSWLHPLLANVMRYVFQNVLLERKSDIVEESLKVWGLLFDRMPPQLVEPIIRANIDGWMTLMCTPIGAVMDHNGLLLPDTIRGSLSRASAPPPTANQKVKPKRKSKKQLEDFDDIAVADVGNAERTFDVRLSTSDPEEHVTMKISCCRALAICAIKTPSLMNNVLANSMLQLINSTWAVHKTTGGLLVQELCTEAKAHSVVCCYDSLILTYIRTLNYRNKSKIVY